MKGIVFHGKGDLRYQEDFPEPQVVNPDDVKLEVFYTGICGSDLKEYTSGPIFFPKEGESHKISGNAGPQIMGHEVSAKVVEVGSGVEGFKVGDAVVVEVTGTCNDLERFPEAPRYGEPKCEACTMGAYNACDYLGLTGLGFSNGGLGEYMVTSYKKLIKFDNEKIPMDVAALIQPIAVSWHAVRVSKFEEGKSALVLGGGPIGLTTIFALKGNRAGDIVVSEPAKVRRELAEQLGVKTFDPTGKSPAECIEQLKKLSPSGTGFNFSYDCSGVPSTFEASVKTLMVRGVATNVAIWANKDVPFDPMHVTFAEKFVTGSICFVKSDFEEVVRAFESGYIPIDEVKKLITSKIHISEGIDNGFLELINHKEKHVKILFSPKEELLN
ncbi:hypothetical protein BVG19_g89 [[Candida] boidinii]|nr:hypothetical protein BVG19_g89 [[Candida] boidinii]OWB49657.1 (R,R)-butanediol dehydrogenase activity protein [[Candida] boidinii]OWB84029.1 (R,R)-butanediol dehydrogenase activity protein [[Candida] boidinii]